MRGNEAFMKIRNELLNHPIADAPLAVIDVETTGLRPQFGDRVVEIAVLLARGERKECEFSSLVLPGRPMDPAATAVNGITDEMRDGQPTFVELMEEIEPLLDGRVLVAHHAQFDLSFLAAEYSIAGEEFVPGPALDTMKIARRRCSFANNRLDTVVRELELENRDPHRALGDVMATYDVFLKLAGQLRGGIETSVRECIRAQGGVAFDPRPLRNRLPDDHPINVAMAESRCLVIRYQTASGQGSRRKIRPLLCQGGYLVAFCHLKSEQRTFRVDRIREISVV